MSKKYRTTVPLDDIGDPADVPHEFAEWSNIDPNEDVELRAGSAPERASVITPSRPSAPPVAPRAGRGCSSR